jgi:hypothetical protein
LCRGSDDDKRHSHSSKLGPAIRLRSVDGGEDEMCLHGVDLEDDTVLGRQWMATRLGLTVAVQRSRPPRDG